MTSPAQPGQRSICFVGTCYGAFLAQHQRSHPALQHASYAAQLAVLLGSGFGDADFYSRGMSQAGWRAHDIVANHAPLQAAWARENGFAGDLAAILVEQVRRLRPDVVYLQDLSLASAELLARLRRHTRLLVGQIASALPPGVHLAGLDLVVSSFPHFVENFRQAGLSAFYQPLAFEPRILGGLGPRQPTLPFTFVGGISAQHAAGTQLLAEVAAMTPLQLRGYGAELLPADSLLAQRHGGEAWGQEMFRTLHASRITLNRHVDSAGRFANNMRLFEATGCGALLVTDYKDNLDILFSVGDELLAYRSAHECADIVSYLLAHPDEAEGMARAGQARTLREHTYTQRMAQTAELLERRLRKPGKPVIHLPAVPAPPAVARVAKAITPTAAPPAPMRYYCSYFDRNYLTRALVLLESLELHETQDFRFIVICLDELTRLLLQKLQNPRLVLLSRHDLERGDEALVAPRQQRTLAEYFWTLSPSAILHALDHVPAGEPLIYLDADLCFYADPGPMLQEMDGHAVLIHEHRYAPGFTHQEAHSGRFNVGLMGFRNDARGRGVLAWWRERCNEWCYARSEDGKFGDQMYLNDWPTRFEGVRVLQHPGGGVAPWNQTGLRFSIGADARGRQQLQVQGQPLVFFHFHAQVPIHPHAYLLIKYPRYPLPHLAVTMAYLPYVLRQEHWADWLRAQVPGLRSGYWPQQALFPGAPLLVRDAFAATLPGVAQRPLAAGWTLLPGNQVLPETTVAGEALAA
jgi:hypothetical protein